MKDATHQAHHALSNTQMQRLSSLLHAAKKGSRLYQKILAGKDPSSIRLQELPIARKTQLMAQFQDWVTDPCLEFTSLKQFIQDERNIGQAYQGRYMVWESSGSSGNPGLFIQDGNAMAVYDYLEAFRRPMLRPLKRLIDPFYLTERSVFVGATDGHFASNVSIERLRRLHPWLAPHLSCLSFLQPTAQLVDQLNTINPSILSTYPTVAVQLAEEQLSGRLHIQAQEIWTGGENLSPSMKQYVQSVFECPVVNSYGASEFLALAFECQHGHLHLNSDWAILESVDPQGQPVPHDHMGATTLLTNLANHAQPLIRYDLGDSITIQSRPCDCGSNLPVIVVQGRCDDIIRLGGSGKSSIQIMPLAICTVLEDEAGLFDFQLIQTGPRALLLSSTLPGQTGAQCLKKAQLALMHYLNAQGASGIRIHCKHGAAAHTERSGKIRRIIALN